MPTDFRFPEHFFRDERTTRLEEEYGNDGIIHLLKLWCWVTVHRPDGVLKEVTKRDLMRCTEWQGTPEEFDEFFESLISAGFVQRRRGKGYQLKGWKEEQGFVKEFIERSRDATKLNEINRQIERQEKIRRAAEKLEAIKNATPSNTSELREPPIPSSPILTTPLPPSSSPPRKGKGEEEEGCNITSSTSATAAAGGGGLADAAAPPRLSEGDGIDPSLRGEFWQALERKWQEKGLSFPTPGCPVSNDRLWREGVVVDDGIEEVPFAGRVIRSELTVAQRSRVHPRQWGWNRWIVEQPREFFATAVERDRLAEKVPLGLSPDEIKVWLRKHAGVGRESEAAS